MLLSVTFYIDLYLYGCGWQILLGVIRPSFKLWLLVLVRSFLCILTEVK